MHQGLLTPSVLLALLGGISAQATYVVDASQGAGHTHTSITAALAAAKDGDLIRVRAGTYPSFGSVRKAVRIVGDANVTIDLGSIGNPIAVSGIAAGQQFVLRNVLLKGLYTPQGFLRVASCAGLVSLQRVRTQSGLILQEGISISDARALHLSHCSVLGGLVARRSSLMIEASDFSQNRVGAALAFDSSRAVLCGVTATGLSFGGPVQPAVSAKSSAVRILRGAGSKLSASNNSGPCSALIGDASSSLSYDPAVTLAPWQNAAAIQGFGAIRAASLPSLEASAAPLGAQLQLDLRSKSGDLFALFLGLPGQPTALPFGEFWLDLQLLILIDAGLQGGTGLRRIKVPVPAQPALAGLVLSWQAQSGPWPSFEYTNSAITVLH